MPAPPTSSSCRYRRSCIEVAIEPQAARRGTITAFDEHVGLGTLIDGDDGAEYPFHCTAIGDGTRNIPVGIPVAFRVAPPRHGRIEATDIWPVTG